MWFRVWFWMHEPIRVHACHISLCSPLYVYTCVYICSWMYECVVCRCKICYKFFRNISRGMPRTIIIRSQRNYTKTIRSRLQLHPRVNILIKQLSKNDTNIDDCWLDRFRILLKGAREKSNANRVLIVCISLVFA